YDNRLLLIEWRRGSALAESRRYDENGNRVSLKRSLGGGKFYEETAGYSQVNFMEFLTVRGEVNGGAAESLTWDYVPDSVFNVGSIKYPNGETRIFTRDHQGRITKNQIGNYFEDYTRDRHGNITEVKQGGIVTRKFSFDGHDRLTGFTRLRGNIEEQRVYAHFPGGEMASFKVTDPEFGGTIYEKLVSRIDCLGRPKAEKETGSNSDANYSYTYPTAAGTEMVLSGPRDSLRVTYDAAGRVRKRVTTVADQTLTPDNNGNLLGLLSQEDGTPYDATFGYNTLDQLTSIALDGPVVDIAPRLDGLPETLTDGASRTVQQDYTLLGEIASITRQNGVEFRFHYDKNRQSTFVGDKQLAGEATSFTDLRPSTVSLRNPGANLTLAAHNHLNLPEQITLPGNGTIDLDYDLQGRAIRQDVNFDTTLYELDLKHDALGRVRKVDFVTDLGGANSLTLDFDKLGPLTTSKLVVAGFPQFVTSSTLYSDGTRNTVTYPTAGLSITEDRQSSGRLNSISLSPGGEILKIDAYKGAQQPKSGTLAGGAISWVDEYDGRKRTLSRRYVRTAGNLPLADVRYQYDGADNVIARQLVHAHGRADLYAYDNGNRISISSVGARPQVANSAPRGSGGGILNGVDAQGLAAGFYGRTYGYDGNAGLDRLQTITPVNPDALTLPPGLPIQFAQTIETPVSGFLFATVIDGQTRTPDALGSATTSPLFIRPPAASGPVRVAASIRHNGLSHLTSLQYTEPGGPAVSIVYEHLPSGLITRRILTRGSQVVADQAYIWDVGRLIEIHDKSTGTNLLTARFFYADSDAPFAADLLQAGALKRFYLLQDAMSTVVAVADDTGAVLERVHYDVFGQPEIEGKDIAPPRVAAVVALPGNELIVHFSERVLPPLASTAAPAFVTATIPLTGGINGSFEIVDAGGPVSIQTPQYEDVTAGGLPFGSVIRIQTARALVGPAILRVKPGIITDEWGLPNVEETATLNLATAPGNVFTGLASGATAPPRLARSSVGNPFLFQGQLFDYEAGLINMRARFYDPSTGLFLERDPLGYEDSPNHYAGLAFNPASLRDPTGTATRRRSVPEPSTGTGNVRSKIPKYPTSGPGSKTPQDTGRGAIYLPEHSEPKPPQPTIVVDDSLNPDPPSPSKAAREEVTKALIYRHGGDSPSAAGPDDISDVFASSGSAPGGFNEKAAANANVGSQIQLLNGTDVGNQKTEVFGLNLFNRALDDKGDPIDQIAHNFDNPAIRDRDSGFYDVGVHGDPDGTIWFKENDGSWTRIDFDTLVALMSAHGYQKGMPIRLSSCHQGNANIKDGIAHKLSAKFDAYLVAPETPLLISRKRGYGPDEGGGWGEFLNGKYLGRFP
ncbi:MAG TPA: RHS repeat-associated core domain-containing protein, partial [Chthoniobacteraceae bacterium]|nr:RHS repeat-associated core domain-containing protein [Chthoniobacteraceae bacterium]